MVRLGDDGCCPMLNLMRLLWCPTSECSGGPVVLREYNQSTCDTKEFVPRPSGYFPHDMTKRSLFVVWSDPVTTQPPRNSPTHQPSLCAGVALLPACNKWGGKPHEPSQDVKQVNPHNCCCIASCM